MDPGVSVQNQNFTRNPEKLAKVPGTREENQKVIYTDNSLEFGKACEDLSWNHCTWPEGWGPQGRRATGGGGLARVPNLRVCYHLLEEGWHTQGGKDELTSCRGTV